MGGTGAGEGNRTLVVSLEGFCSTIELHPLKQKAFEPNAFVGNLWWRGMDSNHRRRKPTDLQSAPFSHSGTPPLSENADFDKFILVCQVYGKNFYKF